MTLFLTTWIILLLSMASTVEPFESADLISAEEFGKVIDTNSAIVVTEAVDSYFGFSTLLIPSRNNSENAWLLVGAPKGNYSHGLFTEPGVLWRCSLGKDIEDTCEILELDPADAVPDGGRICYQRKCRNEKRDNSWLGMTLFRNEEFVIACSPRWQRGFPKADDYKLNGLCYWVPVDLIVNEQFFSSFASEIYSINDFSTQRLFPLMSRAMQVVERIPVWAWGQAGFSGFIGDNNELFLGAPGLNGWNGTILRYTSTSTGSLNQNENFTTSSSTARIRANKRNQTIFSEFTILNTQWLQSIYELEYLGYAVTSGNYFRQAEHEDIESGQTYTMVAASSPRGSSMFGFVLLFFYPETEDTFWLPYQTIFGDQFSSYFGSSLLSIDLNGDGLDELVITAPLFSVGGGGNGGSSEELRNNNKGARSVRTGEDGCVFVYSSKWTLIKFSQAEVICGTKLKGRFGYSVASIGDVNQDGFLDIAVGAPYEDDLTGAIYIYTGHTNFGNTYGNQATKLYMKITPATLNLPMTLKTFGSSISGGVDVDNNGVPDLAIGAYYSNTVIILRARHQISLESKTDILVNDTFVDILKHDSLEKFVIRHCVRIATKAQLKDVMQLDVNVKLIVDPAYKRFKILIPITTDQEFNYNNFSSNQVNYAVSLNSSETDCTEWAVELTFEFDAEYTHPKPFTVLTEVTYNQIIHTNQSHTFYSIINNASVNVTQNLNISGASFERFCSYCPVNVSQSQEVIFPIVADNCNYDGNPQCSPELKLHFEASVQYLSREMQELKNNSQIILGNFSMLLINLTLQNSQYAETAYFPVGDLSLINIREDIMINSAECEFLDLITGESKSKTNKILRCEFGHLLQPGEKNSIKLRFNFHNKVFAQAQTMNMNIQSKSYPKKDPTVAKYLQSFNIMLNVDPEFRVGLMGSSENFTMSKSEIFTELSQVYKVELNGRSPVAKMILSLWVPVFYRIGERIEELVLINEPIGENTKCQIITRNKNFVRTNPVKTNSNSIFDAAENANSKPIVRNARKWKNLIQSQTNTKLKDFLTLKLQCKDENDGNCIQILCEIERVVPNGMIDLTFPMLIHNNVTNELMENFNKPILHLVSFATLSLFNESLRYYNVSESIIYNYDVQAEEPIAIWIYILSITIGILLIILILFILLKCEFFKRRSQTSDWEPIDQNKEIQAINFDGQDWGRWEYSKAYSRGA